MHTLAPFLFVVLLATPPDLTVARTSYKDALKQIEKKLGKKKGKKHRANYQQAKGRAMCDMLAALWTNCIHLKHRQKKKPAEIQPIRDEYEKLAEEVATLHDEKAVVIRLPIHQDNANYLQWMPLKGQVLPYCERYTTKKVDTDSLCRWLNVERGPGKRPQEHVLVHPDTINEKDVFVPFFDGGVQVAHWFYLKTPKDRSATFKLKLNKNSRIEQALVNFKSIKVKSSIKAKLRAGVNILILVVQNKKMPYELGVEVDNAKDLKIGRAGNKAWKK